MGYGINVDVGGTFLDFMVTKGSKYVIAKVPTTEYELGVGFLKGLEESAANWGTTLEELLKNTETIKYCTTIGTNAIIERRGPKLGLITTGGFEDTIFIGRGRQWADGLPEADVQNITKIEKPVPLVPRKLVVGLRERIDYAGNIIMPLVKEDVLEKVRYLVDSGVRGFVVCFLWSFRNPAHERQVKEIIEEEYPEVYLGNMPIILSSEISPKEGEYVRAMTAITNAYIHVEFREQISHLANDLMVKGYKKTLLLVDNLGGCAKSSRTKAVSTHSASPVSGLCGAVHLGREVGLQNIVYIDMGGTSFDIGVVAEGAIRYYDLYPAIGRWRTQLTAIKTSSVGAGGGSIAWFNPSLGRLEVGPRSAGAIPGPMCYDLGGEEPTVTDADVVLGYINPDYYLGGKMRLSKEKALKGMKKIGEQLGLDEVSTAKMIKKVVDGFMSQEIFKEVAFKGYEPSQFVIFACGGAGPTHACGLATSAEMGECYIPTLSPVFGAFGASTLPVRHSYEKSRHIRLFDYATGTYLTDFEVFNSIVEELKDLAMKDIVLEGFSEQQASIKLELEIRYGAQWRYTHIESPIMALNREEDVKEVCDRFTEDFTRLYGAEAGFPEAGIELEGFRLFVQLELPLFPLEQHKLVGEIPEEALKGERDCYWEDLGFTRTKIYEWGLLKPGNRVEGPAIIEAEATTVVIEPGWTFRMNPYFDGVLNQNKLEKGD